MTRKRRTFDIEMPQDLDAPLETKSMVPPQRRGPMASAINETAENLRSRQQTEAAIRAENDTLAHEFVRLRKAGLIVEEIGVQAIDTTKLTRDRAETEDAELAELKTSIADIGLSNPIRVETSAAGRFELIQGFRRLSAYRQLLAETGQEQYRTIPAVVTLPGEGLERLYRQMVDENLVRKDISFAEMAQLALRYARDPQTEEVDPDRAVAQLFNSAGYQKRSYIRAFIPLVEHLGDALSHAHDIPRALGLAVAKQLSDDAVVQGIIRDLGQLESVTSEQELEILRRYAGQGAETPTARKAKPSRRAAKTVVQFPRPQGQAKCVATNGKLEVQLDRDFSSIDRRRIEAAVQALLDSLD